MGGVQARMSREDPRWYNVNRDLAHNFEMVAKEVAARLEDGHWRELDEMLSREGVTMDDLGEACRSFCLFAAGGCENPGEDMYDVLERSGWFLLKPGARIAVMAHLGVVVAGMQFVGVREATLGGEGPAIGLRSLVEHGERIARRMGEGRWRRFSRRCRLRLCSLFGKKADRTFV